MNRGQGPQAPALLRPRRKVVADRNRPALASRFAGTHHLGPTAGMTAFASIGATGSGRRARGQVVRFTIDDGGNAAPRGQTIERVFVDVPFDTWTMHPPIHSNHRVAASGSRLCLGELRGNRSVGRVTLVGSKIQAEMGQEVLAIAPRCRKGMSIGKDRDAAPASVRPDAVIEAIGCAIDVGPGVRIAAGRHGGRAIDGRCVGVRRGTAGAAGAVTSGATIPAGHATRAGGSAGGRGSTFSVAAAAREPAATEDATRAGDSAGAGGSTFSGGAAVLGGAAGAGR